ncbi:MAG: hypothetical protein Q9157_000747 [Trypethelium eluteriae]
MALTFAAGSSKLISWGFSVGDVATIAGAGRKAGNWLMAQMQDRNLLDFLKLDIDSVFVRRGLVDVIKLHQRWDSKITLLRNGTPIDVSNPAGGHLPVIENMDRFTWLMTLIIAALDAAVEPRQVRRLVTDFLCKMFEDTPDGIEYLLREIPHHIQGWRSSACVRGLLKKADNVWTELGIQGQHWPGWIPELDYREIIRLLLWLSTTTELQLSTSSSDAFGFALVLHELGLDQIRCLRKADLNLQTDNVQSTVDIVLDLSSMSDTAMRSQKRAREGMRVPLAHMEECMSLFPGSRDISGRLRTLFEDGMEAASNGEVELLATDIGSAGWDFEYAISDKSDDSKKYRNETLLVRIFRAYLPAHSTRMSRCVQELLTTWAPEEIKELEKNTTDSERISIDRVREELQALLLGYYYALLRPLVDCSSLDQQEVYGSWGFHSHRFLDLIQTTIRLSKRSTVKVSKHDSVQHFSREAMLSLTAFLFAGGEAGLPVFETGGKTIGITSKLSLISSILLGKATRVDHAPIYCLLDCDTSSIPSTTSGLIRDSSSSAAGITAKRVPGDSRSGSMENLLTCLRLDNYDGTSEKEADNNDFDTDFTCNIEPDWENDVTSVILAFRHNGRIISRMPALSILRALVSWKETLENDIIITARRRVSESQRRQESILTWKTADYSDITSVLERGITLVPAKVSDFHGNRIVLPQAVGLETMDYTRLAPSDSHQSVPKASPRKDFGKQVVLILLCRMPIAALCIAAMYEEFRSRFNVDFAVELVRNPEDLCMELADGASVMVAY